MSPKAKHAVYFPVAGDCTYPDLRDVNNAAWVLHRVHDAGTLSRVLRAEPDQGSGLLGLLDLRGHPDPDALLDLPLLLRSRGVGWLALMEARQREIASIRQVVRDYCLNYITLPCPPGMLGSVAGHVHGMISLTTAAALPDPVEDGMLGQCDAMQTLRRTLRKAALSSAPVFIDGETGTGKELAARAIHNNSVRSARSFVAINCGAIAQSLVQSELFGYERGAFTGAQQRKLGRIEHADGGTLFLDEIADLPLETQASLLRFLQEGSFERIGGHDAIRVDVRIVSATHQNLTALIAEGRFRADLYHRLFVLRLRQPPLRERGDDITRLAMHALECYASEGGRRIRGFSSCALRAMQCYPWPGNVRELLNRVRQAMVMCDGGLITAQDLHLIDTRTAAAGPTLEQVRADAEVGAIRRALLEHGRRIGDAARALGVSRVTLYRLMVRHDLRDAGNSPKMDAIAEMGAIPEISAIAETA